MPAPKLTLRQRQVLFLAARGMTAEETAAKLGIGAETVKTHRREAMKTLDAPNLTNAVFKALRTGQIRMR